ncbi:MAG: tRNA lysidine(34) synthetase TilS, partial [Bacteroidales bacterium]|nr:tRNA lysidine(34) synthetase TilS [Bacteroidales bacterium]
HVNFNLRGAESDADTRMVEQWCTEHGITLYQESFQTTEYAREKGISIEMAARELRYNWFYSLMQEHRFNFLAIAHNANDNAETLLLNLTRRCGIEGIAGIREKVLLEFQEGEQGTSAVEAEESGESRKSDEPATPQYIIRPLMAYSRQQIEKYALKFKVPYRTDSTNLLSDYSRNRIRNEVFPQLEKINPSVTATFNRNIKHFQQAGAVLEKMVEERCGTLCNTFNFLQELLDSKFSHTMCGLNLQMNRLRSGETEYSLLVGIVEIAQLMEETEWEFWVYQVASRWGFSPAIIENICKAMEEEEGPKKFLSGRGDIIAVKERGLLKFYLNVVPEEAEDGALKIETTVISRENWRTRKEADELCPTLYIDAAKVQMPLSCRIVAPGDRFSPLGLRGSKKVTDYLTDIKFENLHKGNVLVMCDASGKIICIPGLQVDNKVCVTEATTEILQISVL